MKPRQDPGNARVQYSLQQNELPQRGDKASRAEKTSRPERSFCKHSYRLPLPGSWRGLKGIACLCLPCPVFLPRIKSEDIFLMLGCLDIRMCIKQRFAPSRFSCHTSPIFLNTFPQ